jgi:hypothetical protein
MATVADPDNQTATTTVDDWTDISITFGAVNKDIGDGGGVQPYSCVVDGAGRTVAQIYQYLKYVTSEGIIATQNSIQGQLYLTADVAFPLVKTGPFGSTAGGTIFMAQGIYLENMASADALNYQVIDDNGVTRDPPAPPVSIEISNIVDGSRIQLYNLDTSTELANEIITGTTFSYVYTPSGDENIRVRLTHVTATTSKIFYETTIVAGMTGASLIASQVTNTVYASNNIDGEGVLECSIAADGIQIYVDDPDNYTLWARWYNWYQFYLNTEDGIRSSDNYFVASDPTHYKIDTSAFKVKNIGAAVIDVDGAICVPLAGGRASGVFDHTGLAIYQNYDQVFQTVVEGGTGGLTPTQDAKLQSIPSTTPTLVTKSGYVVNL